jgi:hypothetical protein
MKASLNEDARKYTGSGLLGETHCAVVEGGGEGERERERERERDEYENETWT